MNKIREQFLHEAIIEIYVLDDTGTPLELYSGLPTGLNTSHMEEVPELSILWLIRNHRVFRFSISQVHFMCSVWLALMKVLLILLIYIETKCLGRSFVG